MKKIEAIVKPSALDDLRTALVAIGVEAMTVSEVKSFARQNAHPQVYRGSEYTVDSLAEIKIELVLPDNQADQAAAAIRKATKTVALAEVKVLVFQVDDALRGRPEMTIARAA